MTARRALIGLGGNLGDPATAIASALRLLDARPDTEVAASSRLYRTPPWGKTDQPPFVNAAARIATTLEPRELLDVCLGIERSLKRERTERWGPRTIDLDILDIEGVVLADPDLTLPHPRAAERAFVLVPLVDIAPDARFGGRSVRELVREIDAGGIERLGPAGD